jgi:hypothetical protein
MRRLFCILLMLCLPLQGFAMQWRAALRPDAAPLAQEIMHQVMHDARVSHHHEGDGTVHVDNSDESTQHVQDHSAPPQPATLIAMAMPVAPPQLVFAVLTELSLFIPDPVPECPHRPPSPTLG